MSSSERSFTKSRVSGYFPKKCSRVYAPPLNLQFCSSPSQTSSIRLRSRPDLSRSNSGSQRRPQTTLITFQPAPRKTPSSSWIILLLPRTGPSNLWRLQLTTKWRLPKPSRPARPIAPKDSGSSHSPSPRKHQTFLSRWSTRPRFCWYFITCAW